MGDFSYSNNNPDYDFSFYQQMNGFLTKLCKGAGLDRFDLCEERDTMTSHGDCSRDVLLVREGVGLLSVKMVVQPAVNKVTFRFPEEKIVKKESEFGGRLAAEIEKQAPVKESKPIGPRIQALHWWIIFRGADAVETTFEGDQFDLARINEAFNAIETRLIAEITKKP